MYTHVTALLFVSSPSLLAANNLEHRRVSVKYSQLVELFHDVLQPQRHCFFLLLTNDLVHLDKPSCYFRSRLINFSLAIMQAVTV